MSECTDTTWDELPFPEPFLGHTQRLLDSFRKWLGYELIPRSGSMLDEARRLFQADFVVVSHNTSDDPILNYGNLTALRLWETDLPTLLTTPSRLTAEPVHRSERARLLERTLHNGYVDDYQGIRISTTGKRFRIEQAIVWNLVDEAGERCGQAATFREWVPLE